MPTPTEVYEEIARRISEANGTEITGARELVEECFRAAAKRCHEIALLHPLTQKEKPEQAYFRACTEIAQRIEDEFHLEFGDADVHTN